MTAANAGSAALTIWPNDTAPADSAKTEPAWAPAAQKATGSSLTMSAGLIFGKDRASGAIQRNIA